MKPRRGVYGRFSFFLYLLVCESFVVLGYTDHEVGGDGCNGVVFEEWLASASQKSFHAIALEYL